MAELAEEQFISFRAGARLRELLLAAGRQVGFEPRVTLESNESQRIRRLVARGFGVSILPRSDAERPAPRSPCRGSWIRRCGVTSPSPGGPGRRLPPAVAAFLDLARETFASPNRTTAPSSACISRFRTLRVSNTPRRGRPDPRFRRSAGRAPLQSDPGGCTEDAYSAEPRVRSRHRTRDADIAKLIRDARHRERDQRNLNRWPAGQTEQSAASDPPTWGGSIRAVRHTLSLFLVWKHLELRIHLRNYVAGGNHWPAGESVVLGVVASGRA